MAQSILVPQVGQDLTEAKVVELSVKLGDRVRKGDLIAVVESEKASFEVEAFVEGVVLSLPYAEGDTATVLAPLAIVGEPGEVLDCAAPGATPAQARAEAQDEGGEAAEAAASVPAGVVAEVVGAGTITVPAPPSTGPNPTLMPLSRTASAPSSETADTLSSSPLARRMAALSGIDLRRIVGTGPHGAVVLRDVEAGIAALRAQPTFASDAVPGPIPAPALGPVIAAASAAGPLEVRTLRSGQGSPVVFLHGFGADLSAWRPLIGGIGLGSPMLALDLPGHGASRGHGAARFDTLVDAVGATLREIAGDGLHLVGHSLGAAVSAALTERGDLDVRSLTLIAPAGLGATVDGAFVEGFLTARSEAALATWMRRLVHDPKHLTPTLVRATLASRQEGGLTEAQERVARGVFEGSTQLLSVRDALHRFDGPLAVIVGREDTIIPFREVEAQVPGHAALHRLERVGHLPQVEAAQLVQKLIVRTVRAAG